MLQWLNHKGCLLNKHFCCHPEGRCGFSSAGGLEEFSAIVTMQGRIQWRFYGNAWVGMALPDFCLAPCLDPPVFFLNSSLSSLG